MAESVFQRARSEEAKTQRQTAILESARTLALSRGVRAVTLTDIAAGVGMHKSAMLRYFETREEILLRLTSGYWIDWAADVSSQLGEFNSAGAGEPARSIAQILTSTLVSRPLFCDLLAHAPMNLERGVSLAASRDFKLTALAGAERVAASLGRALPISSPATWEIVATATGMAGALWQMAAPGTPLRELYESDPDLAHAVIDVEPRLTGILTALTEGLIHANR